ncbi:Mrp/NBP35 family ATP-binding protein [Aquicoccus sp. G2-2]|jgi:ATP-binding protein involved in chromosome partitioning|uniref:Mrp/NBP35 family ATP-binding protein n=1 Tax=Aquicoccus sp. G2-2 TaxID=3092120 RepID=UPI002AE09648|nr:Mrp/NBP35 family ATP-binding protein [Aquicoccus sp. G2-2]MEA1112638.1 Mrp/NBP35 family ATP-binding protein [Aquicoccus sp. G2-2]
MKIKPKDILQELDRIQLPTGGTLMSNNMVKALTVENGAVRFVIEAPSAQEARKMEAIRAAAVQVVQELEGVRDVSVVLTAHQGESQAPRAPAPNLKIGRHPTPQQGKLLPPGVKKIISVGSGKGGVGKSTVTVNLAVALARAGKKVGLLDADIYGPSQPRMLGVHEKPGAAPENKIMPVTAHGVKMMSLGLMLDEGQAVIWRGPMLMGALQQLLSDVAWGELDVLIVDLPPGTGDVLLTLAQKSELSGAVMVSTPQDVALIDARKGVDMLHKLDVPILGLIENMSTYICPECGHEAHLFGHDGVKAEAAKLGVPLLAQLPIDLETRLGGDEGRPIAAGEGAAAQAYGALAARLIADGVI